MANIPLPAAPASAKRWRLMGNAEAECRLRAGAGRTWAKAPRWQMRAVRVTSLASHNEAQMSIAIKPELERKIADKVKSGRYASADDVVEDALDLLDRVEQAESEWRAELARQIEDGWSQVQSGQTIPADLAFDRISRRIEGWDRKKHEAG